MIDKIQNNQIREILEELSSRQPNSGSAVPNSDTDVSLQVNYASLIDQAMQAPQTDDDVVDAARKLLLSDQLECQENCQEAAENILEYGI